MAQMPYLISAKNLEAFLEALRHAQAPDKVSLKFIESLGFKSTNDRLFLPLLKSMKLLDDNNKPTSRFHEFLDDTAWKQVLADGIRDAYAELFKINRNAQDLPREQVQGKLRSIGEGKLSPNVLQLTVKTFLELVRLADFNSTKPAEETAEAKKEASPPETGQPEAPPARDQRAPNAAAPSLVYRIEIVLPPVRDQAVFDAIFKSLKDHLLR